MKYVIFLCQSFSFSLQRIYQTGAFGVSHYPENVISTLTHPPNYYEGEPDEDRHGAHLV
jgi:hypothetical protein